MATAPFSPLQIASLNAVRQAICQATNISQAFLDGLNDAFQNPIYNALPNANPIGITRFLWCETPLPPIPPLQGDVPLGKCDGVQYVVKGYLTDREDNPSRTRQLNFQTTVWGPIEGTEFIQGAFGIRTGANIICRGSASNAIQPPGTKVNVGAGDGSGGIEGITILSVDPVTGSDDCGTIAPSNPGTYPPLGVTINLPPQVVVYANPSLNFFITPIVTLFKPEINNNFDIVVPFTLETNLNIGGGNKFEVNGTANITGGDVNFNFYPPGSLGPRGKDDSDNLAPVRPPALPPGNAAPPSEDDDVDGQSRIVGVQVSVSTTALQRKATVIGQGANPDIYAPGLGYVQFFIDDLEGRDLGWTADIPVKNVYQYIPCPVPTGARSVTGTPNAGVAWTLTPVTKSIKT